MIEVLRAGPLSTVQDLGRPGWAHLGVPRSGALDTPALRLANRLVGNPQHAAGLELTLGRCTLRVHEPTTVALTGAPAPLTVDGRSAPQAEPVGVRAGGVVRVGGPTRGVRSYLAFAGGLAVPPVLGSRSTDTLSGLGPAPLRDGTRLPLGTGTAASITSTVDIARREGPPVPVLLRLRFGPRADWFTADARERLCATAYRLTPVSNRVGARLAGAAVTRARAGEVPSEGIVLGAVQVPPDGQPLVFLADHPTTGGYPVVAVVETADLPLLAQARPGATVIFRGPE